MKSDSRKKMKGSRRKTKADRRKKMRWNKKNQTVNVHYAVNILETIVHFGYNAMTVKSGLMLSVQESLTLCLTFTYVTCVISIISNWRRVIIGTILWTNLIYIPEVICN